jgi:hypothetical protein
MNSQEAQTAVEARQGELTALLEQKESANQEYQGLLEARAKAIRALAAGNGQQRRILLDLEGELKPLTLRLEGLTALISDSGAQVDQAKAALKEAEAQEAYDFQAWARDKELKEVEGICQAAPGRKKVIFDLFVRLCQELAQLQLDKVRVDLARQNGIAGSNPDGVKAILETLPAQLEAMIRESGLRPFFGSGYFGSIIAWPLIEVDSDFVGNFPGPGGMNPSDYARVLQGRTNAARLAEFGKGL